MSDSETGFSKQASLQEADWLRAKREEDEEEPPARKSVSIAGSVRAAAQWRGSFCLLIFAGADMRPQAACI